MLDPKEGSSLMREGVTVRLRSKEGRTMCCDGESRRGNVCDDREGELEEGEKLMGQRRGVPRLIIASAYARLIRERLYVHVWSGQTEGQSDGAMISA